MVEEEGTGGGVLDGERSVEVQVQVCARRNLDTFGFEATGGAGQGDWK